MLDFTFRVELTNEGKGAGTGVVRMLTWWWEGGDGNVSESEKRGGERGYVWVRRGLCLCLSPRFREGRGEGFYECGVGVGGRG